MNPFKRILQYSAGDFVAKTLNFFAFIYLARILGVAYYGALEFAASILTYLLLVADGGLELWATREAARGRDMRLLAAQIVPLRFLLAIAGYGVLLLLMPAIPDSGSLRTILLLFGLTLFTQAASLKWVFMGQQKIGPVSGGLVVAQAMFAMSVFGFVRAPESVVWVPLLRLAADAVTAAYFGWLFAAEYGGLRLPFTLRGAGTLLKPSLTMGASHGLAQANYNFDSVLLGFLLGTTAVGLYSAAYKPVTVALAVPVSYFLGLYPALSRIHSDNHQAFCDLVHRSLRLTATIAFPLGVMLAFLAEPIIDLLVGPAYAESALALRVLSWSACLVILRGTYRQALNAAGRPRLDLACAAASATVNIALNLILIPRYGIVGAAAATVLSEVLWLTLAWQFFSRFVMPINPLPIFVQPLTAAVAMGAWLWIAEPLFWIARAFVGALLYASILFVLRQSELRSWVQSSRAQVP